MAQEYFEYQDGIGSITLVGELEDVPPDWQGNYNYRISFPIDIRKDFDICDVVLYSGSSVCIQAALNGLLPIYYHEKNSNTCFFGFFSAINSNIVKDVQVYKGGFPAKYGGRISSIIDITGKSGSTKQLIQNAARKRKIDEVKTVSSSRSHSFQC